MTQPSKYVVPLAWLCADDMQLRWRVLPVWRGHGDGLCFARCWVLWKSLGSYFSLLPVSGSSLIMTSGWRYFKARHHVKLTSFLLYGHSAECQGSLSKVRLKYPIALTLLWCVVPHAWFRGKESALGTCTSRTVSERRMRRGARLKLNYAKCIQLIFPAQAMSLNVFCSCGPSGGPIQINLPDHLCLLDKTWHIGFFNLPASSLETYRCPDIYILVLSQPGYSSAVTKF